MSSDLIAEPGRDGDVPTRYRLVNVFLVALRLGLTSFGGPIAHIGYFREEYVIRRGWLDERGFAGLVALCSFLPGPTSSQLGFAVGIARAGVAGGIAAFLGFTLPSAVIMASLGLGLNAYGNAIDDGVIDGLKSVAAAVLLIALWGMTRQLAPDVKRASFACAAFFVSLLLPQPLGFLLALLVAAGLGVLVLRSPSGEDSPPDDIQFAVGRSTALAALIGFVGLLSVGVVLGAVNLSPAFEMIDGLLRSGALVFGGGHVVLGLLSDVVVPPGWLTNSEFLAGYGAAQALPGPLFTFAAYVGAVADNPLSGWAGSVVALGAIFVPSLLLVVAILPYWHQIRSHRNGSAALMGVNAAVVGFLASAMYEHVWIDGLRSLSDIGIAAGAFVLLAVAKLPPWLVVILGGVVGFAVGYVS